MTDEAKRFFDAIAGRYDRAYAPSGADSRRRMARVVAALPPAPARVLDLGVGTGRELPALLDAGYTPVGLDASQAMLHRCARRARPIDLVLADFWETPLPFEAASFDACVALHGTLAHPPDAGATARLAADLARVLGPGGVLVAEVPSTAWLDQAGAPSGDEAGRAVVRTGPRTCRVEDRVVGASIDALLLDEDEWLAALGPAWMARIEPIDAVERLIVARRA